MKILRRVCEDKKITTETDKQRAADPVLQEFDYINALLNRVKNPNGGLCPAERRLDCSPCRLYDFLERWEKLIFVDQFVNYLEERMRA